MLYYAIILLCLNLFNIKEYANFDNFEKRLIKVSILFSLSFILFSIVSIDDLTYGPLLFFFNGPLLYFLLFGKTKYALFQLYVILVLLCLYFFSFTLFSQNSIENINVFTTLMSSLSGITYAIYFLFFQVPTSKDYNTVKKISCYISIVTSILSMPFFSHYLLGISCTKVFMFNYTIFILSAQFFLAWKYNQIKKEQQVFISDDNNINIIDTRINKKEEITETTTNDLNVQFQQDNQTISSLINDYLIENQMFLNSNLTLDDVALATKIAKPQLTAYFRKTRASNFNQYINRLRVEYSIILLQDLYYNKEVDITIEQLALKCGFNSRVTFYRAFVKIYGFPPSELIRS